MRLIPMLLTVLATSALDAQQTDSTSSSPGIQDNSFLVEEAYNQEAGVVQHISTFQGHRGTNDFDFAFTQEWPIGSIRHQLSYDIPLMRVGSRTGIGDVGLNYRYQLMGDGGSQIAVSPRVSLLLPTGDWKRGRGNGNAGAEVNIPVSYVLSPALVTHVNMGAAATPSARNSTGDRAGIFEWSAAQSTIITASSRVQPMLEVVYSRGSDVIGKDNTAKTESFIIAPGVRSAMNFKSGLQVVPGFSVPLGVGPSKGERGFFVYLSFEHPFKQQR
jgi:hypothetical protein